MNANLALLADVGSTFTKVRVVDTDLGVLIAGAESPSTPDIGIDAGFSAACRQVEKAMGRWPDFRFRLAASSAAGGLRMVTIGLEPEFTAAAARKAALGAGARLLAAFDHRLTRTEVAKLESLAPDIILLSGGTDGGDSDCLLHNAAALAAWGVPRQVVVAGNKNAGDDAAATLTQAGFTATVAPNVMPRLSEMQVDGAREAIKTVFLSHIVRAKGLDRLEGLVDKVLMPTPAAVLSGLEALSRGADGEQGLGDLVGVDVGGATTDVYSLCSGEPVEPGVIHQGPRLPWADRSVEGDLGVRISALAAAESASAALARAAGCVGWSGDAWASAAILTNTPNQIPTSDEERRFDAALAIACAVEALKRHSGTLEAVAGLSGMVLILKGKDLASVPTLILTGGAIIRSPLRSLIQAGIRFAEDPACRAPANPRVLFDNDYVLAAAGLLSEVAPQAAAKIARESLGTAE
jgi:uncharacterized protein (TIGR01319 family)